MHWPSRGSRWTWRAPVRKLQNELAFARVGIRSWFSARSAWFSVRRASMETVSVESSGHADIRSVNHKNRSKAQTAQPGNLPRLPMRTAKPLQSSPFLASPSTKRARRCAPFDPLLVDIPMPVWRARWTSTRRLSSERLGLTWAMTIEAHSLVFIMGGPIWGVPVNNRKEVIQCLIVLCRGCRLVRPGFSPLSRSAPRKTATLKRSGGPRSTMERPPTGGLSLVRGSALNGCWVRLSQPPDGQLGAEMFIRASWWRVRVITYTDHAGLTHSIVCPLSPKIWSPWRGCGEIPYEGDRSEPFGYWSLHEPHLLELAWDFGGSSDDIGIRPSLYCWSDVFCPVWRMRHADCGVARSLTSEDEKRKRGRRGPCGLAGSSEPVGRETSAVLRFGSSHG